MYEFRLERWTQRSLILLLVTGKSVKYHRIGYTAATAKVRVGRKTDRSSIIMKVLCYIKNAVVIIMLVK